MHNTCGTAKIKVELRPHPWLTRTKEEAWACKKGAIAKNMGRDAFLFILVQTHLIRLAFCTCHLTWQPTHYGRSYFTTQLPFKQNTTATRGVGVSLLRAIKREMLTFRCSSALGEKNRSPSNGEDYCWASRKNPKVVDVELIPCCPFDFLGGLATLDALC